MKTLLTLGFFAVAAAGIYWLTKQSADGTDDDGTGDAEAQLGFGNNGVFTLEARR